MRGELFSDFFGWVFKWGKCRIIGQQESGIGRDKVNNLKLEQFELVKKCRNQRRKNNKREWFDFFGGSVF